MALIVPRATTIAGAAPRTQAQPQLNIGAAAAQLGSGLEAMAAKLIEARVQSRTQAAQLDMTSDFAQARLQVAQITDPAQVGPAWDQATAAIQTKYLPMDAQGNSTLDPREAEALSLAFKDLSGKHTNAIADQQIQLGNSQAEANWAGARDRITSLAVTGDPETAQAALDLGMQNIDALLANGTYSPAKAESERIALRQDWTAAQASKALAADPKAFLDQLDKGQWNDLGQTGLLQMQTAAQSEIARRAAEGAKNADIATKQLDTQFADRLKAIADITGQGRLAVDEKLLTDPVLIARAAENPDIALALNKAHASIALRDDVPDLRMMTVSQLQALATQEAARPLVEAYDGQRLTVINDLIQKKLTGYATDLPGTMAAEGFVVPALPAFDPAKPASFAAGLSQRIAFAAQAQKEGRTQSFQPLSPSEVAALKPMLDPKADTATKLALLSSIATASKGKAGLVAGSLGADPTAAGVATLLATRNDMALAESILRGNQKVALGLRSMPTDKAQNAVFDTVTASQFENDPALAAQLKGMAAAYYADHASGINPDGSQSVVAPVTDLFNDTAAQDEYKVAVAVVTGAKPDASGALTIGGIQEVNGAPVWLPSGIGKDQTEAAIRAVGYSLNSMDPAIRADPLMKDALPADPMAALKAASIDGSLPYLGGDNARYWWRTAQFERVGQSSVYNLFVVIGGQRVQVYRDNDPSHGAWQFDLTKLVGAAHE